MPEHQVTTQKNIAQKKTTKYPFIAVTIITFLVFIAAIIMLFSRTSEHAIAEIIHGRLAINGQGKINADHLFAGQYIVENQALIQLQSGEQLQLENGTRIKLFNNTEIELQQGALNLQPTENHNLIIHGPNFTLNSESSALSINLKTHQAEITSGQNTTIMPKRWRPKHYWSFDSSSELAIDFAGDAHGTPSKGANRSNGLLGTGAFSFDNTDDARLNVGSGGGTAPATGTFAVTDGITIEALIAPKFNGKVGEKDIIFRKDQSDRNLRVLLGFQNDRGKAYLKPAGYFEESLSFGLFILGQGYQELKLPLDGENGRPTLKQLTAGNTHHVVATYDVNSGFKAMYIDGVLLAHYQYPAGSRMLSGGAGMANIGNTPNNIKIADKPFSLTAETFNGLIDEVAFYDFALPAWNIHQHYQFFKQGFNYFGLQPNVEPLPKQIKIPLPPNTTFAIDPLTGLPSVIKN